MVDLTLQALFEDIPLPKVAGSKRVADITLDSRAIKPGAVFFALKGTTVDREIYINSAFKSGAIAVVKELDADQEEYLRGDAHVDLSGQLIVRIPRLRSQIGEIAARFFGNPSTHLYLVGITGTNGKTSCSDLLVQLWRALGYRAASVGTLGWSVSEGEYHSTGLTTLDAVENQRLLSGFVGQGVTHVVMEVSSHGIAQHRISGLSFDVKALTNITRDHLDYHGTMEKYAETKLSFLRSPGGTSVLNIDDAYTKKSLAGHMLENATTVSAEDGNASVFIRQQKYIPEGIQASVVSPLGELFIHSKLMGEFNLYNLAVVIAVLGVGFQGLLDRLELERVVNSLRSIPGRIERVSGEKTVFVDYAHTPDALENVLSALSMHGFSKLILVFGCGGDRDKGKRPLMARVAEACASRIYVTTDNPRTEAPLEIIEDVLAGFTEQTKVTVVPDRREAIKQAISSSSDGDVVLIAGKGHENYQEIMGVKYPFSDVEEAQRLIA